MVFPVKDGSLLPADPIDRENTKVEGDSVLQPEAGDLDRVSEDLSYDNATNVEDDAGAGGDSTRLASKDEWSVRGTMSLGFIMCRECPCLFRQKQRTRRRYLSTK